jgi:hypothetical protein
LTLLAPGMDLAPLALDGALDGESSFGEQYFSLRKPNEAGRPEDGALVYGDGHLWMAFKSSLGTDHSIAYKGVLGFDLASGLFDVAIPTHAHAAHPGETSSVPDDLFWAEGNLFVIDTDSRDVLVTVDLAAGTSSLTYEPCAPERKCDALWNESEAGVPWLKVTRWTDNGDGSRTGEQFLERLDPTTGELAEQFPYAGFVGLQ